MGRGGKAALKRRTSKRDKPVNRVSDDSDEDYIAAEDEELIESEEEEYASSFDDETEESLAGFEEEEDEGDDDDEEGVYAKKKVKKVARPNKVDLGRRRNVLVKPKRKRWASYGKEDDSDEWNESDEYVGAERKGTSKPRKKSRVSYREHEDDDGGGDDDLNESDEYVGAERKGASKPRKKSRVSYREQEDGDDLNESDEYVGAERKDASKARKKSRVSYREQDDDGDDLNESDEYVGAERKGVSKSSVSYGEQDDDGDDLNESDEYVGAERKGASKARKKSRVSYREQDDDGGDLSESDEYVGAERKGVSKSSVSYREQDDDGDDLNESDENVGAERKGVSKASVSYREQDDDDNFGDDNDNFDDDDDDDDDEEFRPDEILDDIEDEDVMMETKKNKGFGRPPSRKRSIPTRKKARKVPKVLKRTAKRTRQNYRRKRTSDGEDTKIRTGQHKKKITGRRGRRVISDSDSDFVNSRLSEYEYTISEEEREQIQEATEFCRNLSRTLRNSAQAEESREENDSFYQQPKKLRRKGKEPEEQLQIEAAKQVCGICLSEEGRRTVRGTLNCCSHFFCFACIMEWSKVESRCPLCKQRFITISRSAKSDSEFDLRAMVIQVPERDQVYQPSEEELRGYLDPYESVICTECHHGGDDALMLLCDICDSPAHTYCVGLGHEVPEGNWYCEGCRPAAIDSLNSQGLTPTPDNRTINNFSGVSSPVDNVRETFDLNEAYVPDTPMTQGSSQPSPRLSGADSQASFTALGLGASTVSVRRRIQRQIHQIMFIRRQQDSGINTTQSPMSGNSLSRSQIDRVREPAPQHAVSPDVRTTSNHIPFLGRQSYDSGFFHNADALSARSTMRGPMIPHQASTSAASSLDGLSQNGYTVMSRRDGLGMDSQQMHPPSVVSNTGSDASMSPQCRETSLPPRTLQGALHTRF